MGFFEEAGLLRFPCSPPEYSDNLLLVKCPWSYGVMNQDVTIVLRFSPKNTPLVPWPMVQFTTKSEDNPGHQSKQ